MGCGRWAGRSIDGVQVALSRETISIPWEFRHALLAELRRRQMRDSTPFEGWQNLGSLSRGSELGGELLEAIHTWTERIDAELPEGIEALRVSLAP